MFKKFLYGTLIAALVTIVGVGGCVGVTLYQIQNLVKQVQKLQAEYHQTNKDFSQGGSGEGATVEDLLADPDRVAKYLSIRESVGKMLHENREEIRRELEAKNDGLGAKDAPRSGRLGFLEMMELIRSQFQRLDAVGREHVAQLRAARMAAADYLLLTHQLLATLALAEEEDAPEELHPLRGAWAAYEMPAATVNELLSRSHGEREQKLDVGEMRVLLAEEERATSASLTMAALLMAHMAPSRGRPAAEWLQTTEAPLLDLLVDQYDPAALVKQ
jgi:hypothetical protein